MQEKYEAFLDKVLVREVSGGGNGRSVVSVAAALLQAMLVASPPRRATVWMSMVDNAASDRVRRRRGRYSGPSSHLADVHSYSIEVSHCLRQPCGFQNSIFVISGVRQSEGWASE